MATGTVYLRPSADISLGHPVYPETLTAGYLAICEEVSDGKATYIGVSDATSDFSYTSNFKLSLDGDYKIKNVLSATFKFSGGVSGYYIEGNEAIAKCECTVLFNGVEVFSDYDVSGDYSTHTGLTDADMSDLTAAFNSYIGQNGAETIPEITVTILNSFQKGSSKGTLYSYTSQVAIKLECEYEAGLNIHHKLNGTWLQAQAAYQKQNGAWVEITEDACKSLLSNSLCDKG